MYISIWGYYLYDICREYQTLTPNHYLQLTDITALSPSADPLLDNFSFTTWLNIEDANIDYEYLFSINSGLNRYLAFTVAKQNRFEVYYRGNNTQVSGSRQIVRINFNLADTIQRNSWYYIAVSISYPNIYLSVNCRQISPSRIVYFDTNNQKIKDDVILVMPFPFAGFDNNLVVSSSH